MKQIARLGVISDVQYCDCENDFNFEKTQERFYRRSITQLDDALEYFKFNKCDKVLQLGDLIDGRCKALQTTKTAMEMMRERFHDKLFETFHVIGNHELYNLSREELYISFIGDSLRKYQKVDQDVHYYKVNLTSDICLVVIDCYEISVLNKRSNIENDPEYLLAREILTTNNENESWNDPRGAKEAKYVAFNGAIGDRQIKWLEQALIKATENKQIVVMAGHIPIASSNPNPICLLWNNEILLDLIFKYPCVKVYLCGHDHVANIFKKQEFIHITLPGVIESMSYECAYGIFEITKEKLHIFGFQGYWKDICFSFDDCLP